MPSMYFMVSFCLIFFLITPWSHISTYFPSIYLGRHFAIYVFIRRQISTLRVFIIRIILTRIGFHSFAPKKERKNRLYIRQLSVWHSCHQFNLIWQFQQRQISHPWPESIHVRTDSAVVLQLSIKRSILSVAIVCILHWRCLPLTQMWYYKGYVHTAWLYGALENNTSIILFLDHRKTHLWLNYLIQYIYRLKLWTSFLKLIFYHCNLYNKKVYLRCYTLYDIWQ